MKSMLEYIYLRHLSRVRDVARYTRYGGSGIQMLQRRDYDITRGECTKFRLGDLVVVHNEPGTVWLVGGLDGRKGKIGYAFLIKKVTGVTYNCRKPIGFINHI